MVVACCRQKVVDRVAIRVDGGALGNHFLHDGADGCGLRFARRYRACTICSLSNQSRKRRI
jgi:hypothetical protein